MNEMAMTYASMAAANDENDAKMQRAKNFTAGTVCTQCGVDLTDSPVYRSWVMSGASTRLMNTRTTFCSDGCRKTSWGWEPHEWHLLRDNYYYGPRECQNKRCGRIFYTDDWQEKSCSKRCVKLATNQREAEARKMPQATCSQCGGAVEGRGGNAPNSADRYCSKNCRQKAYRARKREG